ncbi:MAG: glycosyltransferase family 4 protein [Candidatus Brocadiaceae bacterium]|nr:glycosyltransferase family 4 protein [Candidatus Brocadiaceae bacterium]
MNNKIKVLILSKDLRFYGGIVNYVDMLLKNFSDDIQFKHLSVGQKISDKRKLTKFLYPILDNFRLIYQVFNNKINCVHINTSLKVDSLIRDGFFIITLTLIRFRNIVVFVHGWDELTACKIARTPLLQLIFRLIYGRAKILIVLASKFKCELTNMGFESEKIHVNTTMFDGKLFNVVNHTPDKSVITMLFLSRFIKEKGIYETREGFMGVLKHFPEARLIMAGEGPERPNIEMLVKQQNLNKHILLPGYLRGSRKAIALLNADIFVFPTYYGEGCPIVLLEAMAAGLPIITTSMACTGNIFNDIENGILLNCITPKTIEDAIIQILCDDNFRAAVSKRNREKAWANYESSVVTSKIETIYKKAAKND